MKRYVDTFCNIHIIMHLQVVYVHTGDVDSIKGLDLHAFTHILFK